jgi:hypothetical protein
VPYFVHLRGILALAVARVRTGRLGAALGRGEEGEEKALYHGTAKSQTRREATRGASQ